MAIRYLKLDKNIRQFSFDAVDIQDELPVGIYQMDIDQMGIYLKEDKLFVLPEKIYGNVIENSNRIMKTFSARDKSTGVLLNGLKGSGKTITAKYLCNKAVEAGVPVIIVNNKMPQPMFNDFIRNIAQECVILFDEFEKTHSVCRDEDFNENDEQEDLLTLFDGVCSTKKLFILTCNEENKINTYMLNRPARLYYNIKYQGLSKDEIVEFAMDKLNNKALVEDILFAESIIEFSYDILNSLIEELNIHECSISEALSIMNIKVDKNENYEVTHIIDENGKEIPTHLYEKSYIYGNLLSGLTVEMRDDDYNNICRRFTIKTDKLISIDGDKIVFKTGITFYDRVEEGLEGHGEEFVVTAVKQERISAKYDDLCKVL